MFDETLALKEVAWLSRPMVTEQVAGDGGNRMSIKRRAVLAGSAAALVRPAFSQSNAPSNSRLLRFIPQADLAVLDPMWTTAYVTRNHGFMVFDTLFGMDSQYRPSPQMIAGFKTEEDGKLWTLGLRSGLSFHDG